jgi:hypothetical protein
VAKDDATNLDSHFLSAKYFLPQMRKRKWGRFVGISSNMVGLSIPGMSHYIASKMGIIGFMRGLANDVGSDGITANAVLPGLTNTLATAAQSEEQKRATWETQAIKRMGEPEDVTGAILFLASDDAGSGRARDRYEWCRYDPGLRWARCSQLGHTGLRACSIADGAPNVTTVFARIDQNDLLQFVELVEAKKLTVPVAATYPLKDAAVSQVALKNGEKGPGKIVLEVN